MKKLTWLCKRSQLSEQDPLGAWLILMFVMLVACQVHHGNGQPQSANQADAVQSSSKRAEPAKLGADWQTASYPLRLLGNGGSPGQAALPIADIMAEDCDRDHAGRLHLRVRMQTEFGEHLIRLTLTRTQEQNSTTTTSPESQTASSPIRAADLPGERVEAEADGLVMHLQPEQALYSQLHALSCQNPSKDITAGPETAVAVQALLKRITPDCEELVLADRGFSCRLPSVDPSRIERDLEDLQTTMIRTWSRQPYLVARRLAVALRLAEALQSPEPEAHLRTFCRVLKHSLASELPATLVSNRWQQTVCHGEESLSNRRNAATFGLAKAATEIEFLRLIFERTSKLGALTLKLPEAAVASSEIWVSLNPEPDVVERMARETAKIWLNETKTSDLPPQDLPGACWHPVYGESAKLMMLARHLTLTGESRDVTCRSGKGQESSASEIERYMASSITSETEFMMPNRKSKTLRLPVGTYHYELRGMPDDPSEWDDAAQAETRSAGRITWDEKRPRPVISVW